MLRQPDITDSASIEEMIERIYALQGLINGYSPFGAPTRFTQWDGLAADGTVSTDYANYRSTEETTAGRTFYDTNGLNELLLRGDNTGLYGETPTEFTNTLTVGLTSWLKGNVGMGVEPHATYDLTVADQVWIKGKTGIGGVPDTAVMLKVTGDQWITSKLGVGATIGAETVNVTGTLATSGKAAIGAATVGAQTLNVTGTAAVSSQTAIGAATVGAETLNVTGSAAVSGKMAIGAATVGTEQLVVTGLFQATSRGGFGGAPDGTAILKATGAVIFTDDLTIDTDLVFVDKSARTIKFGDTPSLYIAETTDKVGISTATPDAKLDVNDLMRVMGVTTVPTTGKGLELQYNPATDRAAILSFDRGGAAFTKLDINSLETRMLISGAVKYHWDATGHAWFAGTPVAQQTVTGTLTAATLAQLTTVVSNLIVALGDTKYNLIINGTT